MYIGRMSIRNLTKEECLIASLQYLGAAAKLLRLMHDFDDPRLRSCLGQFSNELEATARTYRERALTFLAVREPSSPEELAAMVFNSSRPPCSDTEPPEPSPKTLRSERNPNHET